MPSSACRTNQTRWGPACVPARTPRPPCPVPRPSLPAGEFRRRGPAAGSGEPGHRPREVRLAPPSVRLHECANALQAFLELVLRLRVGEPDEALPRFAECRSRQHGDARLAQQTRSQLALVEAGALDVG